MDRDLRDPQDPRGRLALQETKALRDLRVPSALRALVRQGRQVLLAQLALLVRVLQDRQVLQVLSERQVLLVWWVRQVLSDLDLLDPQVRQALPVLLVRQELLDLVRPVQRALLVRRAIVESRVRRDRLDLRVSDLPVPQDLLEPLELLAQGLLDPQVQQEQWDPLVQ